MGFIEGLVNGFVQAVGGGRIERLCSELGWSIDERDGDQITLRFKDKITGTRDVMIGAGDDSLVLFMVFSTAVMPRDEVPDELVGYLLNRNTELGLGAWQASIDKKGNAFLGIKYAALGNGLTAGALKYICQTMVEEATEFDGRMKRAGLLR